MVPIPVLPSSRPRSSRGAVTGLLAAGLVHLAVVGSGNGGGGGCGILSLFDLCDLLGRPLTVRQQAELARDWPGPSCSMADLQQAGRSVGLELTGVEATLRQLPRIRTPKIIHLKDPDHFAVLAAANAERVQLLSEREVAVLSRAQLERRYSGCALVVRSAAVAGPQLELPEFEYAFRVQGIGQRVSHTFPILNAGSADLTVKVQPRSCNAPATTLTRTVVPPGQWAQLTVGFEVRTAGTIVEYVGLLTNDLDRPLMYLTVGGYVPPDLLVAPQRLHFTAGKSTAVVRELTVRGPGGMRLLRATCQGRAFRAGVGEPTDDGDMRRWRVEVVLQPRRNPGNLADTLTITTSHPDRPVVVVPLTAEVLGDLSVAPGRVFLGFLRPGETRAQDIMIRSRSGASFALVLARLGDPSVGTARTTRGGLAQWKVEVALQSGHPRTIDTTLLLRTDVKGEERLEVPVYAQVLPLD